MQNSQRADVNVTLVDNVTKGAKAASEAMAGSFVGAAKNIGTSFEQMFDVGKAGFELVTEESERLGTALGNSFVSINQAYSDLSESVLSDTEKMIAGVNEFPKAFEEGFQSAATSSVDSFKTISAFGSKTANDLNSSFQNFFVSNFKGDTASMGDLWKGFASAMKDNFINALADMAAAFVTSQIFGLFKSGLNIAGFSEGGIIPEDGLFAGKEGEMVLSRSTVSKLADKGLSFFGPESSEILQTAGTLAAAAGAGFLGNKLARLVTAGGIGADIGSGVGGAIGFAFGGPIGAGIGSFLGGTIGGLFGTRLNQGERDVADWFKEYRSNVDDPFSALALARLSHPNVGSDSVADGINSVVGHNIFPGTSFLRDDAGPEGVNALTIKGFKNLVASGLMSREEILDGLNADLSFFKGRFAAGFDFVPFDNFPALLHRGETVLPPGASRLLESSPNAADIARASRDRADILLELRRGNRLRERALGTRAGGEIKIAITVQDGEAAAEQTLRELRRRLETGEFTVDVSAVAGLKPSARI